MCIKLVKLGLLEVIQRQIVEPVVFHYNIFYPCFSVISSDLTFFHSIFSLFRLDQDHRDVSRKSSRKFRIRSEA
jgi:hypothetical protein